MSIRLKIGPNLGAMALFIIMLLSAVPNVRGAEEEFQCPPGATKEHTKTQDGGLEVACLKERKLVGKNFKYSADGKKIHEVQYEDGELSGRALVYYPNGQMQFSIMYKAGKKDGHESDFYDDGKKKLEADFKDGKPTIASEWYQNGKRKEEYDAVAKIDHYWKEDGSVDAEKETKELFKNIQCVQAYFVCPNSDNEIRWPFQVTKAIGDDAYDVLPISKCRVSGSGVSFCSGGNCRSSEQVVPLKGNHIIVKATSPDFKSKLRDMDVNGVKGQYLPEEFLMRMVGKKVLPNSNQIMQEFDIFQEAPECTLLTQGKLAEAQALIDNSKPQSGLAAKVKSWFGREPASNPDSQK